MRLTFDLDVLRSFVAGVDLGSFAKASERVGRSTSAVSAQLKKLEEQVGAPVLRKAGRGMVLTPSGEVLLTYARRLLALNDEAAAAVRGVDVAGVVRIGLPEDFGEGLLPDILGRFARAHPQVRIEARVARNGELLALMQSGRLDLAVTWDGGEALPRSLFLGEAPLCWIGREGLELADLGSDLPLALFEAPCLMRKIAIAALEEVGRPWHMTFTSVSLSGIWAAVAAGLGITLRSPIGLPPSLRILSGLPPLPSLGLYLHHGEGAESPHSPVQRLAEILRASLSPLLPSCPPVD